jgi:hypothetical protein
MAELPQVPAERRHGFGDAASGGTPATICRIFMLFPLFATPFATTQWSQR